MTAILFDLDNTLVDRDAAMLRWVRQWPVPEEVRAEALKRDEHGHGNRPHLAAFLDRHLPARQPWSAQSIAMRVAQEVQWDTTIIALLERLGLHHQIAIVSNGGSIEIRFRSGSLTVSGWPSASNALNPHSREKKT